MFRASCIVRVITMQPISNIEPRKGTKGGAKGKGEGKTGGTAKGKDGVDLGRCGNCDAEGALRACKQCGAKAYCGESCQRVSGSGAR